MGWLALALIASAIVGAGSVIEKQLVSRYLHSSTEFLAWLGLSMIPHAVIMAPLFPIPGETPIRAVWLMVLTGIFWGSTANFLYRALRRTEVSRVWPIMNVSPVMVALLALVFLGDNLSTFQWVSMTVVVIGTVLISVRKSSNDGNIHIDSALGMLVIAAALLAVGQVLQKTSLDAGMPPLSGFWLLRLGMFLPLTLFNLRPNVVRQMAISVLNWRAMVMVFVAEMVLFPIAVLMFVRATDLGPVALVATLFGTTPVWVLIFSTVLSTGKWNVLNEPLDRGTLSIKVISVTLIVVGVSGIALFQ